MEKRTDGSMKKFLEGAFLFYQADNYTGSAAGYTFAPIDGGTACAVTGFSLQESDIVIPATSSYPVRACIHISQKPHSMAVTLPFSKLLKEYLLSKYFY